MRRAYSLKSDIPHVLANEYTFPQRISISGENAKRWRERDFPSRHRFLMELLLVNQ